MQSNSTRTLRCKVGDLVYCHGYGEVDPRGNRGHVGQIVGPAQESHRDWSVLIPGKPSGFRGGTWAAMDSWLTPIRGDELADETRTEKPRELEAA